MSLKIERNRVKGSKAKVQGAGNSQILQVNASSKGRCRHLTVVFDEILDAIFSNLLRENGSVEEVVIKGDVRCPR